MSAIKACGLCCTKIENFNVTLSRKVILKDVNLHIHCGEMTAIIGLNGAGKSTLLKAILGEVPHTGQLRFEDKKGIHQNNPIIGYVPQQLDFDPGTPVSVLDFISSSRAIFPVWLGSTKEVRENVIKSLDLVEAGHLIDRKLGNLSGGELQRVLLALALDPIPDLLLLDEPVSGIDQAGMSVFYNLLSKVRKDYDLSIILVSHDLPLVSKYADRVVYLNKTVELSGTPAEVFTNPMIIDAFGFVTPLNNRPILDVRGLNQRGVL